MARAGDGPAVSLAVPGTSRSHRSLTSGTMDLHQPCNGRGESTVSQRVTQRQRRSATYSLTMFCLILLVMFAMNLRLPQRLVAIVPITVAGVESVRALMALGRLEASSRERLWPVVSLGLVGLMLMSLLTQVVFYGPQKAYEDCMTGAHTRVAQVDCQRQRERPVLGTLLVR